jgi:hypothetical protein
MAILGQWLAYRLGRSVGRGLADGERPASGGPVRVGTEADFKRDEARFREDEARIEAEVAKQKAKT